MSGNIRHNGEQIGKGVSPSVICYLHVKCGLWECLHIERTCARADGSAKSDLTNRFQTLKVSSQNNHGLPLNACSR